MAKIEDSVLTESISNEHNGRSDISLQENIDIDSLNSKDLFIKYKSLINQSLNSLFNSKKELETNYYKPLKHVLGIGGKRIRSLLVLLSYNLFETQNIPINAALCVELFHNFTLVHDDIMDNAPLRREKPTIFAKWGTNTAILVGDTIFAKAIELLVSSENIDITRIISKFSACAQKVCEGQALDLSFENKNSVTEKEYINMIYKKTGALIGFSMSLGRMLSIKNEIKKSIDKKILLKEEEILYECGKNLGIAFQIQDDLLDIFPYVLNKKNKSSFDDMHFYNSLENKVGKKIGGDIVSNKTTYLTVKAYHFANSNQKKHLDMWFSIKYKDEDKIKAISNIFIDLNIKDKVINTIEFYFNKALMNLKELNNIDPISYKRIIYFINIIINRNL